MFEDYINIIQTSAILITLIILIWQTRQFSIQTKHLVSNLQINSIEMATNKLYRIFEIIIDKPQLSTVTGRKLSSEQALACQLMDLYSMMYEHFRKGLVNQEDWNGWKESIKNNFKSKVFKNEWNNYKATLPSYFVRYVEEIITESEN